ncbi:MAG: ABC transporter substrate-binding protein [Vicinamibacterales bacterium]
MKRLARVMLGSGLILAGGCQSTGTPARTVAPTALRIGLGSVDGTTEEAGLRQVVRNQAIEPLVKYGEDGRPGPSLAERWTLSPDGLRLTIQLKPALFHDGTPLRASDAVERLKRSLPQGFGPLYRDVADIQATADSEVVITFHRRTAFAIDFLDVQITKPSDTAIGTGPYMPGAVTAEGTELVANTRYHAGAPTLDRILLKPYPSVRSAWADLLRGQVDMLYEVGIDAIDSLEPSSQVRLFNFRRHYLHAAIFNLQRPKLKDPALRRLMNESIDRARLVSEALGGFGRPATGPVWPEFWANDAREAGFRYAPQRIQGPSHITLNCMFPSVMSERLALMLQRQLQSVGIDLQLESVPLDEFARRLTARDYDILLTDALSGPTLARPYVFWHSQGPYNYGGFNSREVDAALEQVRDAENDDTYRRGVAAFQRAIANDPPAIFLAWSERARAVSTSFEVRSEPGRDIVNDIHLWRPADARSTARVN